MRSVFAAFVSISSTAPILASMLGLAVGIDYALFIVSRHRNQLAAGIAPRGSPPTLPGQSGYSKRIRAPGTSAAITAFANDEAAGTCLPRRVGCG